MTNVLADPKFVGSFDVDDYVYFFFRENALEHAGCGKLVFSRVARLCKVNTVRLCSVVFVRRKRRLMLIDLAKYYMRQ